MIIDISAIHAVLFREAEELSVSVARSTFETKTQAAIRVLQERLDLIRAASTERNFVDEILEIGRQYAAPSVLDERTPNEIIGYDEDSLPA